MYANLSKVSFKQRLEAYYSKVFPDILQPLTSNSKSESTSTSWPSRFETIYEKYGQTHEGEAALSKKLTKKYGDEVTLQITLRPAPHTNATNAAIAIKLANGIDHEHDVLVTEPTDDELLLVTSKNVDFTSSNFDPFYALTTTDEIPTDGSTVIYDNVEKCRNFLSQADAHYLPLRTPQGSQSAVPVQPKKIKQPQPFDVIQESLSNGPMSILSNSMLHKTKICVLTRYVNCIRGTVTGYVMAFDGQFNIMLGGASEVYNKRYTHTHAGGKEEGESESVGLSNEEIEVDRRKDGFGSGFQSREMKQVMIRGDMVVCCWVHESERERQRQLGEGVRD